MTKSIMVYSPTQTITAKLDQDSCSTFSTFHLLARLPASTVCLNELAVMPPVCIWAHCPLHRHKQMKRHNPNTLQSRTTHVVIFSYGWDFSPVIWLWSPPRNIAWCDLRLDYCLYQPVEGQICSISRTSHLRAQCPFILGVLCTCM